MITFYQLGEMGRLGNQLFQYAALRSLGLENGYETKIPDPKTRSWHGQECLLGEFNIESEKLTERDILKIAKQYQEQSIDLYDKNFYSISDNTNLSGFFQSVHYFEKHKDQICKELTPKAEYMNFAKKYLENINPEGRGVVSVHLRRGDMSDGTNKNYLSFYGENDIFDKNSIYGSYLNKALKRFEDKDLLYLVFTGGSRTGEDSKDIDWAKKSFERKNWIVSTTNNPIKDFSLMMSCNHNIVCHLSTFGWWAAYLNSNKDKKVVAPRNYFYDKPESYERCGFLPDEWELL